MSKHRLCLCLGLKLWAENFMFPRLTNAAMSKFVMWMLNLVLICTDLKNDSERAHQFCALWFHDIFVDFSWLWRSKMRCHAGNRSSNRSSMLCATWKRSNASSWNVEHWKSRSWFSHTWRHHHEHRARNVPATVKWAHRSCTMFSQHFVDVV